MIQWLVRQVEGQHLKTQNLWEVGNVQINVYFILEKHLAELQAEQKNKIIIIIIKKSMHVMNESVTWANREGVHK